MELICGSDGQRLDQFLAEALEDTSRSTAQKLIADGRVLLDGKPAKKNDKTKAGQVVRVDLPEKTSDLPQPVPMKLDIVYEDEDVLVLNKPKGLVVHPAAGHENDTLVSGLLAAYGDNLSTINGPYRPGIVHRIDKDTSGLLAVAKNDKAHVSLADQLLDHTMGRTYDAIVCGVLKEDSGTVDAGIVRHPVDRKKMTIRLDGREAVTHWEVVGRYPGYTHVRCHLETGRTHQIRVHMAYIGHPVLGDTVYGHRKPELGQSTQCLHASELHFRHPTTGLPVMVAVPLPDYFEAILRKLKNRL